MVKLHWLMSLAAAGLFTACSQDELVKDAGNDTGLDGVQEISLMVDNGGDNFGSRGGRPLYSHEAKQNIDEVYVWIVNKDGKVVACTTISNWNGNSDIYGNGSHGRKYKQKLILGDAIKKDPNMPKLENGNYTIYALGRTASSSSSYEKFTLPTIKENIFDAKTFALTSSTGNGEEIFATSVDVQVQGKGGFNKPVILNRQVAGFYAYLSNIPYDAAMADPSADPVIKIKSSQTKNTLLGFGYFANQDLANNGTDNAAMYVVNGATPHATDNVICTINLNKWFNKIQDVDNDGLIDIDTTKGNPENPTTAGDNFSNWKNAYAEKANFTKGSVFGGEFVIPFQNITEPNTLTMELWTGTDETKDKKVETWNITLPQGLNTTNKLFAWTVGSGIDLNKPTEVKETKDKYSIYRNHLYAIGTKAWDKNPDTTVPGTDPDPDPTEPTDPDNKPQPINKTQELTLQVCDNWEVIHGMELE